MDYIRSFDIRLEKDVYYAGETICGHVLLENLENIKIRGIRVILRGKAHAEWKIMKSGERRTVKDDQYLLDDKTVIWGKDKHEDEGSIPILPRGVHQLPFKFHLPQTALPCSFESKAGTVRYYLKSPMVGQDKKTVCCLCCQRGPIGLQVTLERTAYVCGENIRLRAQVENQSDQSVSVVIRLIQYVEYFIDKGVLGVNRNLSYTVLEHRSPRVAPFSQGKYDSTLEQPIKLPVVPPTLIGVCRLIQVYYVLKASLELEKSGEDLSMEFPFTVATVPFRIPNSASTPQVTYDYCSSHVEGGMYISPEFQVGQVYDGTLADDENVLLYRPVYVRIPLKQGSASSTNLARMNKDGVLSQPEGTRPRQASPNSNNMTGGVAYAAGVSGSVTLLREAASSDNDLQHYHQSGPAKKHSSSKMLTQVTVDLHDVNLRDGGRSVSPRSSRTKTPDLNDADHLLAHEGKKPLSVGIGAGGGDKSGALSFRA